ncbi:MAG: divalent-cation tolerance protein CutA, partial [Wolinella sp.]
MKEERFIMIITTMPTQEEASELAVSMVSERLGACVHVKEIESFYLWQDELVSSKEFEVSIKTTHKQYKKIKKAIAKLSPQELPQIITIPIIKGEKEY